MNLHCFYFPLYKLGFGPGLGFSKFELEVSVNLDFKDLGSVLGS